MPETTNKKGKKKYICKCDLFIDASKFNSSQNQKQLPSKIRISNVLARRAKFRN